MALPLKKAFTARSLGVMCNNYQKTLGSAPYLGRQKFGTRKQDSLELRFIKGKNGLPVSLKASNFDAQAELRDVGGFSDIQNEMPFYRESYMVTEKEEQQYADYASAENSSMANQVLREIAKKPMMLIDGARVVPERQIWSLLAPADGVPKIDVVIGNNKYSVEYTPDGGVEHKKDHFVDLYGREVFRGRDVCYHHMVLWVYYSLAYLSLKLYFALDYLPCYHDPFVLLVRVEHNAYAVRKIERRHQPFLGVKCQPVVGECDRSVVTYLQTFEIQ